MGNKIIYDKKSNVSLIAKEEGGTSIENEQKIECITIKVGSSIPASSIKRTTNKTILNNKSNTSVIANKNEVIIDDSKFNKSESKTIVKKVKTMVVKEKYGKQVESKKNAVDSSNVKQITNKTIYGKKSNVSLIAKEEGGTSIKNEQKIECITIRDGGSIPASSIKRTTNKVILNDKSNTSVIANKNEVIIDDSKFNKSESKTIVKKVKTVLVKEKYGTQIETKKNAVDSSNVKQVKNKTKRKKLSIKDELLLLKSIILIENISQDCVNTNIARSP